MGVARTVSSEATQAYVRALGESIREQRIAADITLDELASQTGIGKDLLSRWETCRSLPRDAGRRGRVAQGPRIGDLRAIAIALGTTLESLLPDGGA